MIKGKQTRLIQTLYKDEIKYYSYEIYEGSDVIPHIRTYVTLNDEFGTKIKLEELGQISKNKIEELKQLGYRENNGQSLL